MRCSLPKPALLVAFAIPSIFAQSTNPPLTSLPACVSTCITDSASTTTSCLPTNTHCLCAVGTLFPETVATCLRTQCTPTEVAVGTDAVSRLCGVITLPPNPTATQPGAQKPAATFASTAASATSTAAPVSGGTISTATAVVITPALAASTETAASASAATPGVNIGVAKTWITLAALSAMTSVMLAV